MVGRRLSLSLFLSRSSCQQRLPPPLVFPCSTIRVCPRAEKKTERARLVVVAPRPPEPAPGLCRRPRRHKGGGERGPRARESKSKRGARHCVLPCVKKGGSWCLGFLSSSVGRSQSGGRRCGGREGAEGVFFCFVLVAGREESKRMGRWGRGEGGGGWRVFGGGIGWMGWGCRAGTRASGRRAEGRGRRRAGRRVSRPLVLSLSSPPALPRGVKRGGGRADDGSAVCILWGMVYVRVSGFWGDLRYRREKGSRKGGGQGGGAGFFVVFLVGGVVFWCLFLCVAEAKRGCGSGLLGKRGGASGSLCSWTVSRITAADRKSVV